MRRRQLCEMIQRKLAGGDVPDDFSPKISEINQWVDVGVAAAAMKNYTDGASVDGEYVGDAFYTTFKNLSLTRDEDTGDYYAVVPATPYGLPRGYDIAAAYVEGTGQLAPMIRVSIQQLDVYKRLPKPPQGTFFWFEGNVINVTSFAILNGMRVRVRMAGSDMEMSSVVNCPADLITYVSDYIERKFMQPVAIDTNNDGAKG